MAVKKFPPPPNLAGEFQQLNRWLIEIQSILNAGGSIDPGDVAGLPALILQVAANTLAITFFNTQIAALNTAVAANTVAIAALGVRTTALEARNQILNGIGVPAALLGNDGDLYINNTGAPGTLLYGKIAAAWTVIA